MIIKQRKQLTHVRLKDGRILVSEAKPEEIDEYLNTHSHIMIDGEMHSKFSIESAFPVNMDELEGFILSQPKDIQDKVRQKRSRLKKAMYKDMSLDYAKNYVKNLSL